MALCSNVHFQGFQTSVIFKTKPANKLKTNSTISFKPSSLDDIVNILTQSLAKSASITITLPPQTLPFPP